MTSRKAYHRGLRGMRPFRKSDRATEFSPDLHRLWIPLHDHPVLDTQIAEQGGSGGSIPEHGIFDDGLARANCAEEIGEVVEAVAVSLGSDILLGCDGGRPRRGGRGEPRLASMREPVS